MRWQYMMIISNFMLKLGATVPLSLFILLWKTIFNGLNLQRAIQNPLSQVEHFT